MEKRKVALITMHHVKNYGSVLQTLATQKIIEDMELDVEVIDYRRPWETRIGYWLYLPEGGIKDAIRQMVYFPSKIKQKRVFERFLKKYIKLTKDVYTSEEDFKVNPIQADVFCSGSDQVWNSGWNNGIIAAYYLAFVHKGKRISYASSFGAEKLGDEAEVVKKYLLDYDSISVREKSSIKILDALGITQGTVVLDPTLQLEREQWEKVIKKKDVESDYVLLIQLNRNRNFDQFAVDYAKRRNKRLLRLCLRFDQAILPGEHIIIPDVEDYIHYIKCADSVLTDSFHAVSFSLNFNKEFYCILPPKYSTRLESILDITGLQNRIVNDYVIKDEQSVKIDYARVNCIIQKEREKSKQYLLNAFQ